MAIPVNTQSGIDAMGQMAQVGQAASSSALNFAKAEETYADANIKYAELQQKFQDISQKDMELEVMEIEQQGKKANAEIFTQRNVSMLRNVDNLTKADAISSANGVIEAQMKLDDNQRQQIAALADSVVDPQSHARAMSEITRITDAAGTTPEAFGLDRNWQGTEETMNQWMFNKNAAISSQELMGRERIAAVQYKKQTVRDQTLQEYKVAETQRQFAFKAWQADLDRNAAFEQSRARQAMQSKLPVKRSDIDTMTTSEINNSATTAVANILGKTAHWYDDTADADEVNVHANEIAIKVNEMVDQSVIRYNNTGQGQIISPSSAIRIEVSNLLERTDNNGKVSKIAPRPMNQLIGARGKKTKIEEAKMSWAEAWKASLLMNDPRAMKKTEAELNDLADKAWRDPNRRLD